MWRTVLGNRILQGAEAELFREAAAFMLENMDMCHHYSHESYESSFHAFDSLSIGQQVFVLHEICDGLLNPDRDPPTLHAANEAAIAAVYDEIQVLRDNDRELSVTEQQSHPQAVDLVTAAANQLNLEIDPSSFDEDFDLLVNEIRDAILWDDDYSNSSIQNAPPEVAQRERDRFTIADDYYTLIPDDPKPTQAKKLLDETRELLYGPRCDTHSK